MAYPPIKVTFLGTGTSSGIPMIACPCEVCQSADPKDKRLRSSVMIQSETTTMVVDSGPDFRFQMLRADVKSLDGIVFTHPHKDHIAGLDDVRAYNFFSHKAMQVYANTMTQEALKREFAYAFGDKKYPGIPEISLNLIDGQPFSIGDISILPFTVMHLNMPVLGFRFGDFTYITDANYIGEQEKALIRGSKVIVINALRRQPHISHFNLHEAIALSKELAIPEAYFTHMSHQLGRHKDVSRELPPGVHLAYDGLELNLEKG